MKLRNVKTGEIATLTLSTNGEDMIIMGNDMYAHITKLSELKDYEDYEEPKEYWYIDDAGVIQIDQVLCSEINMRKAIGNYFETREEAEKAVEKLKAVKRLKEANIDYKLSREYDDFTETMHANVSFSFNSYPLVGKDLDLLFRR